ncbi:hypothetical protein NVP1193O_149 [Vibrio phage 1.193.O._10N.286.52.C6]|nr:hypothetical protein NVP1193O_149 [Vibrio phage 1.193.O._10N.286.52.C6]
MNLQNRLAFFFINLGVKCLPKEYQNYTFIKNCIMTNKIKLESKE